MMPIFFHAESHFWIAYLFFFNGFLLTLSLRGFSPTFRALTQPVEALVLSAFFLSILINASLLRVFDLLNFSFTLTLIPIVIISVVLCILNIFRRKFSLKNSVYVFDYSWMQMLLYFAVFIILFYNGGLIDQLSDAWWHMSMANKIGIASSFDPELGHLTGAAIRTYPPLWHANLALANVLSGISIPVFWNSFTAWGAALKVMAFYLFAFGLTRNVRLSLFGALLFFLLPGIGNAYMRVSAWPSHIAYMALYSMFYVFTQIVGRLPNEPSDSKLESIRTLAKSVLFVKPELFVLAILAVLVYFTHRAELLWFAAACWCYLVAGSISRSLSTGYNFLVYRDNSSLRLIYIITISGLLLFFTWLLLQKSTHESLLNDVSISYLIPVIAICFLFLIEFRILPKISFLILFLVLLGSVNYTHLASLFDPELALPRGQFHESPTAIAGYFGQALYLPSWHLQLRGGLLYTGIIAVPLSVFLVFTKPSKANLFICVSSVVALLFCTSPYLYHWLQTVLGYHSPWRIAVINFHPLIIAIGVVTIFQNLKKKT